MGSCAIFNFCSFALFFYFWFCFLLMFNTFFRCMYWCTGSYSPLVATATLNLTQVLPLSPFPPTTKKCRKLMKPKKTADLCRHHWFPQCREIPKWRCVTTQIWAELLIGRATWELCFKQFGWSKDVAWPSTTQIWVVIRHQNGISVLLPQMLFSRENSGGISKCWLFSQVTNITRSKL